MSFTSFKENLRLQFSNILGVNLKRKFVVFQSDDWGSIRTYDKKAYNLMNDFGLNVTSSNAGLDCLESNEDFELLFNLLLSFKDRSGNHPKFTAYCAMANPDFDAIENSDFNKYFYEKLNKTVKQYPNHNKLLDNWKRGRDLGIFTPQLHSREHIHLSRWMKMLTWNDGGLKFAFKNRSVGASRMRSIQYQNYLGAFYPDYASELPELHSILNDAGKLFLEYLGEKPKSFVAPNAEEPEELANTLAEIGIKTITRPKIRKYPLGDNKFNFQLNWPGKVNNFNQIILVRNAFFEPCLFGSDSRPDNRDWVASCIREVGVAFNWNKPAIISTHRWNYVGGVSIVNREKGLIELQKLIKELLNRWPDIEFVTTDELSHILS